MLKRMVAGLGQAWIILGITLLLLVVVDQLLRLALPKPAADQPFDASVPAAPDREHADAVKADTWIHDYWSEHADARGTDWRSYVYWRRQPFVGELVNVDAHGFRVTPTSAISHQRSVWLFGGSVVWGTGNRDSGTLAAQLEKLYAANAPELGVRVRNFGESGYVSQQSAIAFQLALRCHEPAADLAIFLDGANDVFASLQSNEAGNPQNEENRRREFNSANHLSRLMLALATRFEGIARLIQAQSVAPESTQTDALAEATARAYVATARQTQALAKEYGVDLIYGFQPTVFDRANPPRDEATIVGASAATHVRLQRATRVHVNHLISTEPSTPITDLGGVFDDAAQPVYFDFVHLSEAGQALLAAKLYQLSLPRLKARVSGDPGLDRCTARPLGFTP